MPKCCIFHIPLRLDRSHPSASQIRPLKMCDAFRSLGYEVFVIEGDSHDRREQIAHIEGEIAHGTRFDFLYSESSTMPTLLTDADHLPRAPFLDFGFFRQCRRNGIPIGLFYRDMYWLYPSYARIGLIKSSVAKVFYRYDLGQYRRLVDVLFLPSLEAGRVVAPYVGGLKLDELPPGCDPVDRSQVDATRQLNDVARPLRLFYVGGIGGHYGFHELLGAIAGDPRVRMRMCVRPDDWAKASDEYGRYLATGNVEIVHASGEGLSEHFAWADAGLLYFDRNEYRSMAIPFKTFEYMGNGLPLISTDDTAIGRFIEQNGIGFSVARGAEALSNLIEELRTDEEALPRARRRCFEAIPEQSWGARAQRVVDMLSEGSEL